MALRDYRRGDPMRHIHWRSWAKTGKLAAFRTPSGQRLFLRGDVERVARERGARG